MYNLSAFILILKYIFNNLNMNINEVKMHYYYYIILGLYYITGINDKYNTFVLLFMCICFCFILIVLNVCIYIIYLHKYLRLLI